ncbi:hypothetical protein LAM20_01745 [Mycobacterium tuberculosis]|nr:hypothetical protein [Mycobacterium tuberculosis]
MSGFLSRRCAHLKARTCGIWSRKRLPHGRSESFVIARRRSGETSGGAVDFLGIKRWA